MMAAIVSASVFVLILKRSGISNAIYGAIKYAGIDSNMKCPGNFANDSHKSRVNVMPLLINSPAHAAGTPVTEKISVTIDPVIRISMRGTITRFAQIPVKLIWFRVRAIIGKTPICAEKVRASESLILGKTEGMLSL
jgi:hypothetical protein